MAALDAVPTYGEATLELATLRRRLGRSDDALDLLDRSAAARSRITSMRSLALGETLLDARPQRDAVHAFARVLRFDPKHVGALYHEGVLLAEQRRYREAIERWRRVVELEPARGLRAPRAARNPHGARSAAHPRRAGAGLAHGDRRTAPRARHPRRLPAPRSEPEDGHAARDRRSCATTKASCYFDNGRVVSGDDSHAPAIRIGAVLLQAGRVIARRISRGRGRAGEWPRRARAAVELLVETRRRSAQRSSSGSCALHIESVVFELMSWQRRLLLVRRAPRAEMPRDAHRGVDGVAAHGGRAAHRRVVAHRRHDPDTPRSFRARARR